MKQEEVFEVVKKHILDQMEDELTEEDIDTSKSMVEIGMNSLDIVEVVTNSMRELRVKIPREELSELKNLQGLIDLLTEYKTKQEKEQNE